MNLHARKPSSLPAPCDMACDVALEAVAALPAQPSKPAGWHLQRADARIATA
jgi:hypothetical protein